MKISNAKISDVRDSIEHCERLIQADWHSCVGKGEKKNFFFRAFRAFQSMTALKVAPRFTDEIDRRENVSDRLSKLVDANFEIWREAKAEFIAESKSKILH